MSESRRPLWPYALVIAMAATRVATDLWWLSGTTYPFTADFLDIVGAHARAWRSGSPLSAWFGEHYYPPLPFALWGAFAALIGDARAAVPIVSGAFAALGAVSLVALARRVSDREWPGLVGAAVLLGAPQMVFYARTPLLEVPMASLLPATMWAALACRRFEKPAASVALGLATAAGLLCKWTFVTAAGGFGAALAVDIVMDAIRRRRETPVWPKARTRGLILALLPILVFALPWYAGALSWEEVRAHAPTDPTPGTAWSLFLWYPVVLREQCLGAVGLFAAAAALPLLVLGARRRETGYVILGLLLAYYGLWRVPHKNVRYAAALIPYAAMTVAFASAFLQGALPKKARLAALVMGVLIALAPGLRTARQSLAFDVFPNQTGDLERMSADCLGDYERVTARLESRLAQFPGGATTHVAIHPLTRPNLSFNYDLIFYALRARSLRGASPALLDGYEIPGYEAFADGYRAADLLMVPADVWEISDMQMLLVMRDVVNTLRPGSPIPPPPPDALFRERILLAFDLVETVETQCGAPIEFYRRRP